jgi:DNA relaxase NicK
MFSETTMRSFIDWANERNANATRCDLNLDDYAKVVTPLQVEAYAQGPDIVTHVRRGMTQRGFGIGTKETTGVTVYIGQPSSRQRLRVYDKGLESNGEIDAVRWELISQKEAAQTLLLRLGSDRTGKPFREWGELFSERLVSFVDFRIATDDLYDLRNRRRCPWFVKLVDAAKKASSYVPKLPRKIDDVVSWVTKAVGPSLKMLATFWDGNGIIEDIIRGSELKPKHRAILARSG